MRKGWRRLLFHFEHAVLMRIVAPTKRYVDVLLSLLFSLSLSLHIVGSYLSFSQASICSFHTHNQPSNT